MNFRFLCFIVGIVNVVFVVHAAPVSPTPAPTAFYLRAIAGVGTSTSSGDGGPATSASFGQVWGLWSDTNGVLYLTEASAYKVRKIDNTGIISTFIGSGSQSLTGASGPALSVGFDGVFCIYGDTSGNIYFSSRAFFLWRYDSSSGIVSRYAGALPASTGYNGDGGQATAAALNSPMGLFLTTNGILYFADAGNNRIRNIDTSTGIISLVAGTGTQSSGGDNGPATSASFYNPFGVWGTTAGILYIADTYNNRIRQITAGIITTVAGTGTSTYNGDNIPATTAAIRNPYAVGGDTAGNLYIADTTGCRIRQVSSTGRIMTTSVGSTSCGEPTLPDQLVTNATRINSPSTLFVDSQANIYFSEVNYIKKLFLPPPTASPSSPPSFSPSRTPSRSPTFSPSSRSPTQPTQSPTLFPTTPSPSVAPSITPSYLPTTSPSDSPSGTPTESPTSRSPTRPTQSPTVFPTTLSPSVPPSLTPSYHPTTSPSDAPSMTPNSPSTAFPTNAPTTNVPTFSPTDSPTVAMTAIPTTAPTISPSNEPTLTMAPSSLRPNAFNVTNASSSKDSHKGLSKSEIFYAGFFPALFILICIISIFFYLFCKKNNVMNKYGKLYPEVTAPSSGKVVAVKAAAVEEI